MDCILSYHLVCRFKEQILSFLIGGFHEVPTRRREVRHLPNSHLFPLKDILDSGSHPSQCPLIQFLMWCPPTIKLLDCDFITVISLLLWIVTKISVSHGLRRPLLKGLFDPRELQPTGWKTLFLIWGGDPALYSTRFLSTKCKINLVWSLQIFNRIIYIIWELFRILKVSL